MKGYSEYKVLHYNARKDGRIEYTGAERLVLTPEEAERMSYTAVVVSKAMGFGGEPIAIVNGKHAQFDMHLGWVS